MKNKTLMEAKAEFDYSTRGTEVLQEFINNQNDIIDGIKLAYEKQILELQTELEAKNDIIKSLQDKYESKNN